MSSAAVSSASRDRRGAQLHAAVAECMRRARTRVLARDPDPSRARHQATVRTRVGRSARAACRVRAFRAESRGRDACDLALSRGSRNGRARVLRGTAPAHRGQHGHRRVPATWPARPRPELARYVRMRRRARGGDGMCAWHRGGTCVILRRHCAVGLRGREGGGGGGRGTRSHQLHAGWCDVIVLCPLTRP